MKVEMVFCDIINQRGEIFQFLVECTPFQPFKDMTKQFLSLERVSPVFFTELTKVNFFFLGDENYDRLLSKSTFSEMLL